LMSNLGSTPLATEWTSPELKLSERRPSAIWRTMHFAACMACAMLVTDPIQRRGNGGVLFRNGVISPNLRLLLPRNTSTGSLRQKKESVLSGRKFLLSVIELVGCVPVLGPRPGAMPTLAWACWCRGLKNMGGWPGWNYSGCHPSSLKLRRGRRLGTSRACHERL
jgi:hypothetical protein